MNCSLEIKLSWPEKVNFPSKMAKNRIVSNKISKLILT